MYKVPLRNPRPNIDNFVKIVNGQSIPTRGVVMEYSIDEEIRRKISIELLGLEWVEPLEDKNVQEKYLKNYIEFWYRMGYDYVRFELNVGFVLKIRNVPDTAFLSRGIREWAEEGKGIITSWRDFENYKWPQVKDFDF